jgi:hypothetical protein
MVGSQSDEEGKGTDLSLRDGPLARLLQLLDGSRVLAEILLATDEDDWEVWAEVKDLGDPLRIGGRDEMESCVSRLRRKSTKRTREAPGRAVEPCELKRGGEGLTDLLLDVVQGIRRIDREADQDDVRVRVGQGPQSVVVLLSGGIPKGELDLLAVDLNVGNATQTREGKKDVECWLFWTGREERERGEKRLEVRKGERTSSRRQ